MLFHLCTIYNWTLIYSVTLRLGLTHTAKPKVPSGVQTAHFISALQVSPVINAGVK